MRVYLLFATTAVVLASCATYPDVRPGAGGNHYVTVTGDDEDELERNALQQAKSYCKEEHKKKMAIVSEEKKYIGDMNEKDYKNAKRASAVAKTVGSAGAIFGGENERNAGGVVGLAGVAGDAAIGKGYKVTIKFNCD